VPGQRCDGNIAAGACFQAGKSFPRRLLFPAGSGQLGHWLTPSLSGSGQRAQLSTSYSPTTLPRLLSGAPTAAAAIPRACRDQGRHIFTFMPKIRILQKKWVVFNYNTLF